MRGTNFATTPAYNNLFRFRERQYIYRQPKTALECDRHVVPVVVIQDVL